MTISDNGINLIKGFEGLVLHAYKDIAGVWTIGYGSTRYANGNRVVPGGELANESQAADLLKHTLGTYVQAVHDSVKVPLNQNQFDALVSFTYNLGAGALASSTLLKKLNAGDYNGAADQFLVWNKITDPKTGAKVVSDALVKRRKAEQVYFLK
ncbi:lysozyme [Mucilaginibacter sp. SP1R1]|uniref:lysozyme n=1 Tax=Mucilaginibacter sp. SP1R1 TaxID=2723091 RepID=UPI001616DEE1|nr:lysozyme [Mucilaginibacter sp. SP1R1]MBB6149498.1 lysozyme [Mucilaginibacter sp. SP1R1]